MVAPKETEMEMELELGSEMELKLKLKLALEPATSRVLLSMLASGREGGGGRSEGKKRQGGTVGAGLHIGLLTALKCVN